MCLLSVGWQSGGGAQFFFPFFKDFFLQVLGVHTLNDEHYEFRRLSYLLYSCSKRSTFSIRFLFSF